MKMDSLILMIFKTPFQVQSDVQLKEQNNQTHHQIEKDLVFHLKYKKVLIV